ncbi:hypothetical protein ACFVL4_21260 [Bacillus subtilis]|uniref:hypothetical protein n=1 Tax=Bacillus subtilis group TaxID=653685 RepID=UPI000CE01602|nr:MULTISPECIES: hypothetical protein [Bacillus subtilis group]AVB12187.1 hypothetical protein C3438_21440 [Bacillus velezensis]AYK76651.1 hypothetical protein D9C12_23185 [Bacillus subtilis subsp. subtilis]AYL03130.1 hypothetical protein D9C08_22525 [Bacillus subtilis subsp. subtilis]MCT6515410.1 hypothetical protein [Bacillus subtilis]MDK7657017.1 hypothetical protein [Bacillus subtilis]
MMKKYSLVMKNGEVEATLSGAGETFVSMANKYKRFGYEVKEVSKEEFDRECERQELLLKGI